MAGHLRVYKPSQLPRALFQCIFKGIPVLYHYKDKQKVLHAEKSKKQGLRQVKVGYYLYIEQNPNTDSRWAKEARKGKRILWIIDARNNKYLGKVVESENGNICVIKLNKTETNAA